MILPTWELISMMVISQQQSRTEESMEESPRHAITFLRSFYSQADQPLCNLLNTHTHRITCVRHGDMQVCQTHNKHNTCLTHKYFEHTHVYHMTLALHTQVCNHETCLTQLCQTHTCISHTYTCTPLTHMSRSFTHTHPLKKEPVAKPTCLSSWMLRGSKVMGDLGT